MKTIYIHFAEGFEEVEALTPADILRRAEYKTVLVSTTGKLEVTGAHNITIVCDQLMEETDYSKADLLLLPGGMPGAKNLDENNLLKENIIAHHKNGKALAAICAAPMVLGHLDILKDKKATCFPGFEQHLLGAKVSQNQTETDGNIITGKGVGAAIEFSLAIVSYFDGKEKAIEMAQRMVVKNYD